VAYDGRGGDGSIFTSVLDALPPPPSPPIIIMTCGAGVVISAEMIVSNN
jgi:hypothetical protein